MVTPTVNLQTLNFPFRKTKFTTAHFAVARFYRNLTAAKQMSLPLRDRIRQAKTFNEVEEILEEAAASSASTASCRRLMDVAARQMEALWASSQG